ncbi:hypothetical protein ASG80_02405 [Agromyces sp. Soil535]|nr:hypothetical protein ASG80_02405 [Agromyces sp. Soil535]
MAEKLRIDPDAVLSHVAGNLARLREVTQGDLVQGWLDQWEQLTTASIDTLIDGMLEQSSLGRELRQNSPFAGALTRDERLAAIKRAKQSRNATNFTSSSVRRRGSQVTTPCSSSGARAWPITVMSQALSRNQTLSVSTACP